MKRPRRRGAFFVEDKYIQQAAVLFAAHFFVCGEEHFDLTVQEVVELLQILDQPNSLAKAYEGLQAINNEQGE